MTNNIRTYIDGILHGPYKLFFANGELKQIGLFLNGRKHGRWTTYLRINGKTYLGSDGVFIHGKKFGLWSIFTSKTTPPVQVNFWNGGEIAPKK